MKDYYAILDVPSDASLDKIKEQYRFLAQAWHPDKFPAPGQKAKAEEKFKEINEAYEVLGNPTKRIQYDRERSYQSTQFDREEMERHKKEQARQERDWFSRQSNELQLTLVPSVEMVFRRVPASEFLYSMFKWKVYLDEYWIGKHPVTNAQFRAFLMASEYPYGDKLPDSKEDHPVVNVTWLEATAFCKWVAEVSRQPVRLPTDAEWEKAARGVDGREYPWGDQEPNGHLCNFRQLNRGTTPVGRFSPRGDSPFGCVDMAGNVCEWVADWHVLDYIFHCPGPNPKGPSKGDSRILRGGPWLTGLHVVSVSGGIWDNPDTRNFHYGFRCAC